MPLAKLLKASIELVELRRLVKELTESNAALRAQAAKAAEGGIYLGANGAVNAQPARRGLRCGFTHTARGRAWMGRRSVARPE